MTLRLFSPAHPNPSQLRVAGRFAPDLPDALRESTYALNFLDTAKEVNPSRTLIDCSVANRLANRMSVSVPWSPSIMSAVLFRFHPSRSGSCRLCPCYVYPLHAGYQFCRLAAKYPDVLPILVPLAGASPTCVSLLSRHNWSGVPTDAQARYCILVATNLPLTTTFHLKKPSAMAWR